MFLCAVPENKRLIAKFKDATLSQRYAIILKIGLIADCGNVRAGFVNFVNMDIL